MPRPPNADDRDAWLADHEFALDDLAADAGIAATLVHAAAELVLIGLTDDAIYDHLRAHLLSLDGQHNELAGAPLVLREIRRLAATTEENRE